MNSCLGSFLTANPRYWYVKKWSLVTKENFNVDIETRGVNYEQNALQFICLKQNNKRRLTLSQTRSVKAVLCSQQPIKFGS